jgi:hypothetical protein
MDDLVRSFNRFQECIIVEMRLLDYQTTLELIFDYIWAPDGTIRPNLDAEERVRLQFRLVQEIHITNALNDSQLREPEMMNWGMNEVAWVEIKDDEAYLKKYNNYSHGFHHAEILWEGDKVLRRAGEKTRRIDVVFADLEIVRE